MYDYEHTGKSVQHKLTLGCITKSWGQAALQKSQTLRGEGVLKKKISWSCFTNTVVSAVEVNRWTDCGTCTPEEGRVGRRGRPQERSLSSSDKKFTPSQTRLLCNTSVTRDGCAAGAQTADIHPTPGATTRDVCGPAILLHASSNLHLQKGSVCVCFSSNREVE